MVQLSVPFAACLASATSSRFGDNVTFWAPLAMPQKASASAGTPSGNARPRISPSKTPFAASAGPNDSDTNFTAGSVFTAGFGEAFAADFGRAVESSFRAWNGSPDVEIFHFQS